jgi:hypothetical protein
MKNAKYIGWTLVVLFFTSLQTQVLAQSSFKEVEKMRKEEEKRLAKLAKAKAKKASNAPETNKNENNQWENKGKAKAQNKVKGKNKKNVPKAAQNLSRQRQQVGTNTQKYRNGNKGVTKAAKAQAKTRKRVKGDIEVW